MQDRCDPAGRDRDGPESWKRAARGPQSRAGTVRAGERSNDEDRFRASDSDASGSSSINRPLSCHAGGPGSIHPFHVRPGSSWHAPRPAVGGGSGWPSLFMISIHSSTIRQTQHKRRLVITMAAWADDPGALADEASVFIRPFDPLSRNGRFLHDWDSRNSAAAIDRRIPAPGMASHHRQTCPRASLADRRDAGNSYGPPCRRDSTNPARSRSRISSRILRGIVSTHPVTTHHSMSGPKIQVGFRGRSLVESIDGPGRIDRRVGRRPIRFGRQIRRGPGFGHLLIADLRTRRTRRRT